MNETWMDRAACKDTDAGLWFVPDAQHLDPTRVRRAKAVCRYCPVRPACLDWSFTADHGHPDFHAILGGLTGDERRRIWRRRRVA